MIFYLAISVAVCGFIKPYKDHISNILDILLSATTMILLLLRNTNELFGDTTGRNRNNGEREMSINSSKYRCDTGSKDSSIVWILIPFYYLPVSVLVLAVLICCIRLVMR